MCKNKKNENYTVDQLIFRKIIKIVTTTDFKLKCTKINFGWGSAPHSPMGERSAIPQLE